MVGGNGRRMSQSDVSLKLSAFCSSLSTFSSSSSCRGASHYLSFPLPFLPLPVPHRLTSLHGSSSSSSSSSSCSTSSSSSGRTCRTRWARLGVGLQGSPPGLVVRHCWPSQFVVLLFAILLALWRGCPVYGFVIQSIEHRPTFIGKGLTPYPPMVLRTQKLDEEGDDPNVDSSIKLSRFQHVGCFQHPMSMTASALYGVYRDPNDCIQECKNQEIYQGLDSKQLVVGVHNDPEQGRCGCALRSAIADFLEEEDGTDMCTYQCKNYLNPICGGPPDYWGIFMEYDHHSMSGQGAYDPWRYIFYTVVSFKEESLTGSYPADGVMPERYFLNAVDVTTGDAAFEYQMSLTGILYGLQYDIDSTRLVGLYTTAYTGRIRTDLSWTYRLAVILINTTNEYRPYMQMTLAALEITEARSAVSASSLVSDEYMAYSGASAIFSKLTNCYVFTQANYASLKYVMKDRVFIVRIPDGYIIREEALDFKVTNLYANQQYGDLSAIGPRLTAAYGGGRQSYVYLGRVYRSAVESATLVDWTYSSLNPSYLASLDVVGNFHMYPGVSATEHLYNQTALAHRYRPSTDPWGVMTITQVQIRSPYTVDWWCTGTAAEGCQGTLGGDIPYASIFNLEPGIPLTLKAPALVSPARFNVAASAITVNFDRSTLQGARTVDTNGDYVPDEIDYTYQRTEEFDCGEIFSVESTYKLGLYPDTYCMWTSTSSIRISIAIVNISVGESIYLLPDTIYAVNSGDEWSPAASGGVQIGLPDPLDYPVIIPSGSTTVDLCTEIELTVDSLLDGGLTTWAWTWIEGTSADPNPEDLASRANFEFDQTLLAQFKTYLASATAGSNQTFNMPSTVLEEAAEYRFMVSVTSRWNLTTSYTFVLQKLSYPAPTVYIEGPTIIYRNRTQDVALVAVGAKSTCDDTTESLAYRWTVSDQAYSKTGVMLDFDDYPDIVTTTNILNIPSFVLEPTTEAEWNSYNFTVACYLDTELGAVEEKTAYASVTVRVRQSTVVVYMNVYDRALTITGILVLDARSTEDPDYPPASEGMTFSGTFEFRCLTPLPERAPCFSSRRLAELGLSGTSDGFVRMPADSNANGGKRRLQATDAWLDQTTEITACRQDYGTRFIDGGTTYYTPLFDDLAYCGYSRGVLMVDSSDFIVGSYKWTIRATHYDGRQASRDVYIEMVAESVPRITLEILNPNKYLVFPITEEINIAGTEESETQDTDRTYSWQFFVYETNPDYSPEEAEAALNDGTSTYTVDEYIYVDKTGTVYNATDTTKFVASQSAPDLTILANALQASTLYKIRLNVILSTVSGYSEISFETAGAAPSNGQLVVDPVIAAFNEDRTLSALNWQADDSPLTYVFGYYSYRSGSSEPSLTPFSAAASQVKTYEVSSIPMGTLDEDGNYSIPLYVTVCTPYDACTTLAEIVTSNPAEDNTAAANELLDEASSMDDTDAMNAYDAVMSVAGDDLDVQNSILDGLATIELSADVLSAQQRAALLASMVANGGNAEVNTAERIMSEMENLVTLVADASLVSSENTIATDSFSALGGLLPGAVEYEAARGQSTTMGRFKAPTAARQAGRILAEDKFGDAISFQAATRMRFNHPPPMGTKQSITKCPSAFCDQPGLWCLDKSLRHKPRTYRCCNSPNPNSFCEEPPCWFAGGNCPVRPGFGSVSGQGKGGKNSPSSMASAEADRRLSKAARTRKGRAAQAAAAGQGSQKIAGLKAFDQPGKRGDGWFDHWVNHNFPVNTPHQSEVSEYNLVRGFHGWHPDVEQRRLEYMVVNETIAARVRLRALEDAETNVTALAKAAVAKSEQTALDEIRAQAELQMQFEEMTSDVAAKLKAAAEAEEALAAATKLESNRNDSQRITRIVVMRDSLCKALIKEMARGSTPLVYNTLTFRLTIGKNPDLTSVSENFSFPEPYFKRAADSPDEPTGNRTLTGFSFIYVEYFTNIYSWSDSNPVYNDSALITLIALKANTDDIDDLDTVDPPIKTFKQFDLYSNAICLYWDRFASDTAGGAWSKQGVVNDGDACLSTHLSDIAVFIDGTVPDGSSWVDAATAWNREVWETHCVGCDTGTNLFPITTLGMLLFTMTLLVLLGYVQDERNRSNMKKNKVRSRYFFDGDGLTAPLNVDDPIAYSMRDVNLLWFWIGTFANVALREHALVGPVFYHETFTRPQRLLCLTSLMVGLLAINAAIHSNPGYFQQAEELEKYPTEFMVSGILSGLLIFPIYCGLLLMFNLRPSQVKKRLIKKTYSTRELDLINEQRQKLANQSAMMPQPGNGIPALMPGVGQTTLLNVPAPLPLPPMPGGKAGGMPGMFALPGMPGSGPGSGMLALPGMSGNMPLPPPPKYPPPPKNARMPSPATLMPPLNWPKVGPPPVPFPALTAPDGLGGTSNLPMLGNRTPVTPPDTGATPLQLADQHHHSQQQLQLPGTITSDFETRGTSQPVFKDDASHGMVPPVDLPGTLPQPRNPPGAFTPPQTPPGARTPPGRPGAGAGVGGLGGAQSPGGFSRQSSQGGSGSAMAQQILPHNAVPPPLFIRGQPPANLPSPFPALPPGPSGLAPWIPSGMPPPPGGGPMTTFGGGGPGAPGMVPPNFPPVPPPPPREDNEAFVRRIKLTYMDKVVKEHDKHDLLEDFEELGKDVPFWVFDTMTLMPYLAACTFALLAIFVILQYSVKFVSWQEQYWLTGSIVGFVECVLLLELFRIVMMTLVELRKFENRRKAKAGDFLPRRVRREDDRSFQPAPPPRLWKRAVAPPKVPAGPPPAPRPAFLPKADLPAPPRLPPSKAPAPLGPGGVGRLPLAPARPPVFSAAAMSRAGALDEPPVPGTPHSFTSGQRPLGMSGAVTPPSGARTPLQPSTPKRGGMMMMMPGPGSAPGPLPPGGNRTPTLQSAGDLVRGGGPPSPTHSTHSLNSLAQSLNQQVKAGRHAEAPPPPPVQPGAAPAHSSAAPPPAPAAPPPSYSRPPSRPTSAGSVPKPPPPRP